MPDLPNSLSEEQHRMASEAYQQLAEWRGERLLIVVFGLGSYGDVLQTTALLAQLRKRFLDADFVFVHPHTAAQHILKNSGLAEHVMALPSVLYGTLRSLLLKGVCADLLVNCRYVIEYQLPTTNRLSDDDNTFIETTKSKQAIWLPWVSNFPFDNDVLWRAAASQGKNMFELMAETAGFPDADLSRLIIQLDDDDFGPARELAHPYVVVSNSAEALTVTRSRWTKTMPTAKLERIVRKLKRGGVQTVLLGASLDEGSVNGVDRDLRGTTNLREAAAILQGAQTFLAPEGGIANLARSVGKKGVVFFGSTPAPFFAFEDNLNVRPQLCGECWWVTPSYLYHCPRLQQNPECTHSINEDEVVQAVRRLLA